ncbi:MAG: hypothetical protein MJ063_00180 [Lachnospiraceae bacterium]|nr:hypothetical protein [Lachnospiraceae bacterium]
MALGLGDIMKVKSAWDKFARNHPKFPMFLNAVKGKGVPVGTVIGISIDYPGGEHVETNIKVSEEDLDLVETLKKV